jgi:hypothetical protein
MARASGEAFIPMIKSVHKDLRGVQSVRKAIRDPGKVGLPKTTHSEVEGN